MILAYEVYDDAGDVEVQFHWNGVQVGSVMFPNDLEGRMGGLWDEACALGEMWAAGEWLALPGCLGAEC